MKFTNDPAGREALLQSRIKTANELARVIDTFKGPAPDTIVTRWNILVQQVETALGEEEAHDRLLCPLNI